MTAIGAGYLAGLAAGYWSSLEELTALDRYYSVFFPRIDEHERRQRARRWHRAVHTVVRIYR